MSKGPQSLPPEKLPQVTAFQDKFTRKFMDSTEPVKEGYYLFRSGVNGYTMLFPENAKIAKNWYHAPDRFYEDIEFGESNNNISYYVKVEYEEGYSANIIDNQLNMFRTALNYEDAFEKIKLKDKDVYLGKREKTFDRVTEDKAYSFFSFIKSKDSDQGLRFYYSATCVVAKKRCGLDVKKEEQKARTLMESVSFIRD